MAFQWSSSHPGTGIIAQTVASWSAYNIPAGVTSATFVPNNNIQFNTGKSNAYPILTITGDGDVIWNGKPSQAADILVRSFQLAVEDAKGVTKAAKRRYYLLACQNLLNKATTMEHNEFVDFLKKQVYNRETKVIMDSLKYGQN